MTESVHRYYANADTLARLIHDVLSPIELVVSEVESLCERELSASGYYKHNAHLQYPSSPWIAFVKSGAAEYLGWPRDYIPPASESPAARSVPLPIQPATAAAASWQTNAAS